MLVLLVGHGKIALAAQPSNEARVFLLNSCPISEPIPPPPPPPAFVGIAKTIVLALMKLENERNEVRDFVERMFRLMSIYRFDARDIRPAMASFLVMAFPGGLPEAWGGMVFPFTMAERHQLINKYLRENSWVNLGAGSVLVEMGCGFPPQTAIDAATFFPDWQVIGADPCFEEYLLYDRGGNYAGLDINGRVRFFNMTRLDPAGVQKLLQDPPSTFRRFAALFERLAPKLPQSNQWRAV